MCPNAYKSTGEHAKQQGKGAKESSRAGAQGRQGRGRARSRQGNSKAAGQESRAAGQGSRGMEAGQQGGRAGQQSKFNLQAAAEGRTFVKKYISFLTSLRTLAKHIYKRPQRGEHLSQKYVNFPTCL